MALDPGQTQTVTFTVDRRALSHWDDAAAAWRVTPGHVSVEIGRSSRDIVASGSFDAS